MKIQSTRKSQVLTEKSIFGGRAKLIDLPIFEDERGTLCPLEFPVSGFLPVRAFLVVAHSGAVRGGHGHYKARQLLLQISGSIEVELRFDGKSETTMLGSEHRVLLIEAGVWAQQRYIGIEPTLMAFSDLPYNESDYFHDFR